MEEKFIFCPLLLSTPFYSVEPHFSPPTILVCFFCLRISLCGSAEKESSCNAGDLGSIPGLGTSPGEGKGYPLQYSMD